MIDKDKVTVENVIFVLGYAFALKLLYFVLIELKNGLCGHILPRLWYFVNGQTNLKTRYGEWAVVTGSSQGIGRSYALELARRGLNHMAASTSSPSSSSLSSSQDFSAATTSLR